MNVSVFLEVFQVYTLAINLLCPKLVIGEVREVIVMSYEIFPI